METEGNKALREAVEELKRWIVTRVGFVLGLCWVAAGLAYCAQSRANDDMRGWLLESQIKEIRLEQGPRYAGDYRWYIPTCRDKICTYTPRHDLYWCEGFLNCREAAQHGENER